MNKNIEVIKEVLLEAVEEAFNSLSNEEIEKAFFGEGDDISVVPNKE